MSFLPMILALVLWPLAHIPIGAPLFLARNENREIGPIVLAGSLAVGQLFISVITYLTYLAGLRFSMVGFLVLSAALPLWFWGCYLILRSRRNFRVTKWLIGGLCITAALLALNAFTHTVTDSPYHFSKVASILKGDHPYFVPLGSKGFLRSYHFGSDSLVSFWTWSLFHLRQWVPFNAMAFWSAVSAYILFWAFARRFLSEPLASLVPFFAFWIGSWFSVMGFKRILFDGAPYTALLLGNWNLSFYNNFKQPPMVFGMPVLLSALWLSFERKFVRSGILFGPLLLANQALYAFGLGLILLEGIIKEKRYLMPLAMGLVLGLPFLPSLVARELSNSLSFGFGLPVYDFIVRTPTLFRFTLRYLLFFCPLLPLYIYGFWLSMRKRDRLPLAFATAFSFLVPHFLYYTHTEDMFKFWILWGVFGLPLVLWGIANLWKRGWVVKALVSLFVLPVLAIHFLGFAIGNFGPSEVSFWEKIRPEIAQIRNRTSEIKGGVLVIPTSPTRWLPMEVGGYISNTGDTVKFPETQGNIYYAGFVLSAVAIPFCPSGNVYGRAWDEYVPLYRRWDLLDYISDSLLRSLDILHIAIPADMPTPARAPDLVVETRSFAIYSLSYEALHRD